jgi:hypothetical protein
MWKKNVDLGMVDNGLHDYNLQFSIRISKGGKKRKGWQTADIVNVTWGIGRTESIPPWICHQLFLPSLKP